MLTDLQEINPSNTTQLSGAPGLVHHLFKYPEVRYNISGARQCVIFLFFFCSRGLSVTRGSVSESRASAAESLRSQVVYSGAYSQGSPLRNATRHV